MEKFFAVLHESHGTTIYQSQCFIPGQQTIVWDREVTFVASNAEYQRPDVARPERRMLREVQQGAQRPRRGDAIARVRNATFAHLTPAARDAQVAGDRAADEVRYQQEWMPL